MIDGKEYRRITNCSDDICGFQFPRFTIEEVQQFLINLGYEIKVHKAPTVVHLVESEFGSGEVRRTGETAEMLRETILAVKTNQKLPDRLDSEEAKSMYFVAVFQKELKRKLFSI